MSVDKFGRYIGGSAYRRGPPGEGFKRTADGDYDMQNRLLRNVATPFKNEDAANLETVDNKCSSLEEIMSLRTKTMIEQRFSEHNEKVTEMVSKAYHTVSPVLDSLVEFQGQMVPAVETLKKNIANLEEEVKRQNSENTAFETAIKKKIITGYETLEHDIKKNNTQLYETLEGIENKYSLKTEMYKLKELYAGLDHRFKRLETHVKRMRYNQRTNESEETEVVEEEEEEEEKEEETIGLTDESTEV